MAVRLPGIYPTRPPNFRRGPPVFSNASALEARDNGLGQRVAGFGRAVSQASAVTFVISVVEAIAVAAGAHRIGRLVFHRENVSVLARFLSCAPCAPRPATQHMALFRPLQMILPAAGGVTG